MRDKLTAEYKICHGWINETNRTYYGTHRVDFSMNGELTSTI